MDVAAELSFNYTRVYRSDAFSRASKKRWERSKCAAFHMVYYIYRRAVRIYYDDRQCGRADIGDIFAVDEV